MIVEKTPTYGAGGAAGLISTYAINFGNDAAHIIPLAGMYQGDPVKARTIFIDNYSSAYAVTISAGNYSAKCPAFSTMFAPVDGYDSVTLTAENVAAGIVNVNIQNYATPASVNTRTFQASSLTNDPYWTKVQTLIHCDGPDGSTGLYEEKTGTVVAPATAVSKTQAKFGNASIPLCITGQASGPTIALNNFATSVFPASFDGFFFPLPDPPGNTYGAVWGRTLFGLTQNSGTPAFFGYRVNSATKLIDALFVENGSAQTMLSLPSGGVAYNAWHYLAVNMMSANSASLYLDGVFVSNFSTGLNGPALALNLGYNQFSSNSWCFPGYIDEVRFTNYPRFISGAPVPTQPFFNQ